MKKSGFTLAEILISLMILGIIASLTIPVLISKYNKYAIETALKKQISLWNNAFNSAINATGENISEWHLDENIDSNTDIAYVKKYLAPYVNITEYIRGEGGTGNQYTVHNARGEVTNDTDYYLFCLVDGTCVHFENHAIGATAGTYGHILMEVDVNGRQGPNCWGKDVFMLNIYPDKSGHGAFIGNYPVGHPTDDTPQNRSSLKNLCYNDPNWGMLGRWCTGVFMGNGFKFPDDYPWL